MEQTDQVLIERLVRDGDANAFSDIVAQYAGMVYSTGRRVLRNDAQAADVVQETFFHFLKSANWPWRTRLPAVSGWQAHPRA